MKNTFYLIPIAVFQLIFSNLNSAENHHVTGMVYGLETHDEHQDTIALYGAEVFWLNTSIGTITDQEGRFHLDKPDNINPYLVVRYVAFESDTVLVNPNHNHVFVVLKGIRASEGVSIVSERPHFHDHIDMAENLRTISDSGLRTLACCDLSESFESTASVEVEQTDAVSGAKRIKMLGLAGFYTQILIEKKPVMRGLIKPFGLEYIPGAWIESIDISKGTASVMTGYESITGQINIEFKKPEKNEPIFLNLYQNSMGKTEGSIIIPHRFNPHLSTMVLAYGNRNSMKLDQNKDAFLDMPLKSHLNVMNRWNFQNNKIHSQFGVKVTKDHRDGGQVNFDFSPHQANSQTYGFHNQLNRYELYIKTGIMLDEANTSSIGLILSIFHHRQDAFWGIKQYEGKEYNAYANLVFQKSFQNHKLSTGTSLTLDNYNELYNNQRFEKKEQIPGTFIEYTYKIENHFTGMAGFRYDHHNLYGDFYTPRFHIKVQYTPLIMRMSLGKGYRSPNIFVENLSILASSKELSIQETLQAEEAWNYGFQLIRDFTFGKDRPGSLIIDFYRTLFQNQMIVDMEQEIGKIHIYNLNGKSFSNSLQAEINGTLFKGFETTAAWRWNDVKTTINNVLTEHPLTSKYKGLLVFSYLTPNKSWQFDFTSQFNGKSRIPNTDLNPVEYQKEEYSPPYVLLFAQIKRKFRNWEIYLGMENIADYKQPYPIIAWQEPFSPYFDSSLIWGPTIGRRIYIGWRYN